jgi:ethanolamine utilization protein EutP (predicted NTPase)
MTTTKKPVIEVITKSDLPQKHKQINISDDVLHISSENKEGFDELL